MPDRNSYIIVPSLAEITITGISHVHATNLLSRLTAPHLDHISFEQGDPFRNETSIRQIGDDSTLASAHTLPKSILMNDDFTQMLESRAEAGYVPLTLRATRLDESFKICTLRTKRRERNISAITSRSR